MTTLEIKRDILLKARDRSALNATERAQVAERFKELTPSIHTLDLDLKDLPRNYWRAMLDDSRLTPHQRAIIARFVFGMDGRKPGAEGVYEREVSNPVEFGSTFSMLGTKSPNGEILINGRWYAVIINVQLIEDENKVARDAELLINLSICELTIHRFFFVPRDLFLDEEGQSQSRTVLEVLRQFGLRELQTPASSYNLRLVKAERESRENGKVVLISGPALIPSGQAWNSGLETRNLGVEEVPSKAIVEPELEVNENQRTYYGGRRTAQGNLSRLPFVRLFCLEIKRYVYVDIDDVQPYEFDVGAIGSLCLPDEMLSVLNRVFEVSTADLFGDLIRGKHGGVIVLATGKPGVGKTLTAEIYAERSERPLYILEMGELGTTAAQVEEQLRLIFHRVMRWNAVLQFDECEIFLLKRGDDLERSAIVGIFLRLLDYYQGMLFLTSNRPEIIDTAVLSRVMLRLDYPDLTPDARERIWRAMFAAAKLNYDERAYDDLARVTLNGRQIRNLTRLTKILYPDGQITLQKMNEVFRYGGVMHE